MTELKIRYFQAHRRKILLQSGATLFGVLFTCLIISETLAQDDNITCPCFTYEEVEAIFLRGEQLTADQGERNCKAEDYSVERSAEVTVFDQDYAIIAQARVEWYDYDPGRCEYIDTTSKPGVERNVRWEHPAPEAEGRACFDMISRVITKSDTSGKCNTYP